MTSRRSALVTGGSRGIGAAIALDLLDAGFDVFVLDLHEADAASQIGEAVTAGDIRWMIADIGSADGVERSFAALFGESSRLDVLVNNAAVTDVHKPWAEVSDREFEDVLNVNVHGTHRVCRQAFPLLCRSQAARVINISSTSVMIGAANMLHYVASKAAIVGYTRSLARAWGPHGITVNTVAPGAIRTEAEIAAFPDRATVDAQVMSAQCIDRRGEPRDIANAVRFLASEESGFITGQLLNIDGGWVMH